MFQRSCSIRTLLVDPLRLVVLLRDVRLQGVFALVNLLAGYARKPPVEGPPVRVQVVPLEIVVFFERLTTPPDTARIQLHHCEVPIQ